MEEDDNRFEPMCCHYLSGSPCNDILLGAEECTSPFGTYELSIPIDDVITCALNSSLITHRVLTLVVVLILHEVCQFLLNLGAVLEHSDSFYFCLVFELYPHECMDSFSVLGRKLPYRNRRCEMHIKFQIACTVYRCSGHHSNSKS